MNAVRYSSQRWTRGFSSRVLLGFQVLVFGQDGKGGRGNITAGSLNTPRDAMGFKGKGVSSDDRCRGWRG